MKLVESIEGCADCAAEEAFKLSQGHECGESSSRAISLCEVVREWRLKDEEAHSASHVPLRCDDCQRVIDDHRSEPRLVHEVCASGQCDEWRCWHCGGLNSSSGPVDCPTCGSLPGGLSNE